MQLQKASIVYNCCIIRLIVVVGQGVTLNILGRPLHLNACLGKLRNNIIIILILERIKQWLVKWIRMRKPFPASAHKSTLSYCTLPMMVCIKRILRTEEGFGPNNHSCVTSHKKINHDFPF